MPSFPPTGLPLYERFVRVADDYSKAVTLGPEFGDGGQDSYWGGGQPIMRWEADWGLLTRTERDAAEAFVSLVKGIHLPFTLTYRDGTVYGNVRIESYESGHDERYLNTHFCKFRLIKRP